MASIQKRGKKYAVVYTYEDADGTKRQKWESFSTKKEAQKQKAAIEHQLNNGTFIPPNNTTVEMFLNDFVELYGFKRWGLSVYSGNISLIRNYINPLIGDQIVQDVNRRTVDSLSSSSKKHLRLTSPTAMPGQNTLRYAP